MFARGHAGQRRQVSPAEGRPRGREFLGHRSIVLLGVQRAVLADREIQQQVEHRPGGVAKFAIAMNQSAGAGLIVAADRRIGLSIKAANYSQEQLKAEQAVLDALKPGEDLVALQHAFDAVDVDTSE